MLSISSDIFGITPEGEKVARFVIGDGMGWEVELLSLGATLAGVRTPDRNGNSAEITLGHGTLAGWLSDQACLGASVGRYANRIANARFRINDMEYLLEANDGAHHLHGGIDPFNKRNWIPEIIDRPGGCGVKFTLVSPDDDQGYPGLLTAQAQYFVTPDRCIELTYLATTSAITIVNLVQHVYWNFSGAPSQTILDHILQIPATQYLPVENLIPTGEQRSVNATPMDFTTPHAVGDQIEEAGGYDCCYTFGGALGEMRQAAILTHPGSGRTMTLHTDQLGMQLYTGNFLDGTIVGRGDIPLRKHAGLCLETEMWPDSPNRRDFPSPVLHPGQRYLHRMQFGFGVT